VTGAMLNQTGIRVTSGQNGSWKVDMEFKRRGRSLLSKAITGQTG